MAALERKGRTSVDVRIARAAEPGMPMTTRRRLLERCVDVKSIAKRQADGRLWEIWAPVLLINVRPHEVTPDQVMAAAILLVAPSAAIDGASALERRGLWDRHDGHITISSDRGHANLTFGIRRTWRTSRRWRRRRSPIRIRFVRCRHASRLGSEMIGGVRTRCALDALMRAAPDMSPHELAYIIKRGEHLHEFTLDDVERLISARTGRRGVRALRRAVELRRSGSAGTKSRSEDVALPCVAAAFGMPCVNVRGIAGIPTHEPDFCWPDLRLIVEIDGGHHVDDPAQRKADLENDALLRSVGWTVVRIPWKRVWVDLPGVLAEIRAAFASA